MSRRLGIAAVVVGCAILAAWAYVRRMPASAPGSSAANSYADPALCVNCHRAIAGNFRKTGMGRSFGRLPSGNTLENFTSGKPFYHKASDTYFAMIQRGGDYIQRRWQIGFDGAETNIEEKRVDYVMGSGNHSRTYLHLTSRNTLQQLPLHWYAEGGGHWGMSPGYDRADHPGSTRLAGYDCMFCHNAYPKIPPGYEEEGAERVYVQPLPEGIECQRCHGPGKRHIDLALTAGTTPESLRAAIVNPKRLAPERSMEVCMQCHLHTTAGKLPASMLRAGRGPFSYLPGQPLVDFRLSFDRTPGASERFENLGSAYRLRQSQCFLRSEGRLECITCHDPHNIPRGKEAAAHYDGICLDCHRAAVARTPASGAHTAGGSCVSCHMPKRRTDDEVHVVMTDHYIQRRKPAGDLLAEKVETHETTATQYRGEVVLYYPAHLPETVKNALDVAVAQIRDGSNLKDGLARLRRLLEEHRPSQAGYYADLAEGYLAAGDGANAIHYFEEAARRSPASAFLLTKLGNALTEAKQWAKAEEALRRATALAPGDALAWGMLGWALWQEDKTAEARAALEKGVNLNPELPELHNNLASLLGGIGDRAAAEKELRAALRILPGIAEWQLNLGRLLASRGELAEARYYFEQTIRLKPDDAVARLDYARLLAAMGSVLAAKGDLNGAGRELQTAVRLQPDLWGAHLELAMVLGRKGDTTAAVEHLKIAAGGTDAEAKARAQQLLQRLGR